MDENLNLIESQFLRYFLPTLAHIGTEGRLYCSALFKCGVNHAAVLIGQHR